MKTETLPFQVVLYEGDGAQPLAPGDRFAVLSLLLDKGYAVRRVAGPGQTTAPDLPSPAIPLIVIGDFGGAAPVLEDAAGRVSIATHDIGGLAPDAVLDLIEQGRIGDQRGLNQPGAPGMWKPWFPVIDYDRCTNCMQCLSFCLFDVYGVDEKQKIQVKNQDNCKTNCPACSRVCPEVAIMFPKYAAGPINGDVVNQADVQREKMKVDISSLLGGDIYSRLRDRSDAAKSRFSKERSPDKALEERKKCLVKLQQSGIIPAEVLAELDLSSLPSPEEIQRRAAEANARAQAAREAAAGMA
ncbi:MAG: ferredoxin family protein [Verrucomicrobiales bacterium]|nr:ferredoxin family protein [Verrucomicrobiales bacterium]